MRSFSFFSATKYSWQAKLFGKADYSNCFAVHIPCSGEMFHFFVGDDNSIPFGLDEILPFGPNPMPGDPP